MALLYQELGNIPGLAGNTWKEKAQSFTQQMYGENYNGSKEQGLRMLADISKGNYPKPAPVAQPVAPPAPAPTTTADVMKQYTDPFTGQIVRAAEIPLFQDLVGDYMNVWDQRLAPGVQAAAESEINPEALRQYNQAYEGYMGNLVSSGGQRFGRGFATDNAGGGLAGVGNLKAAAERNRQATLQDWMGQQKSGIEDLWYNKTKDAWNLAKTQLQPGGVMNDYTIPTAEEAMEKYGNAIGTGESQSPFYG